MDLAYLYAFLLFLGVAAVLSRVALYPALIFQYPYFVAAVFAVFIMPQVVSLIRFPGRVSDDAVADVMLMSCLCFGAAVLGYRLSPSVSIFKKVVRPVHEGRMLHISIVFIAIGLTFDLLRANMVVQTTAQGGMTGLATVYLFFASLVYPGFAIALMLYLKSPSGMRLFVAVAGGIIPMISVFHGRREPAAMLGLTLLLGRYFARRVEPPRFVIFGALFFAMLAIPATGTYRSLFFTGQYEAISEINLIDNFSTYLNEESILELRNAAAVIESTKRFATYDFGRGYWNQIVFRFIPAQLFGREFKESLMLGETEKELRARELATNYEFATGSTITGMGDSFRHFGWAGCLFFTVMAVVFRSIWLAALRQDAFFAQLFYLVICTSAMRAVTHQTLDFLPGLMYQAIFLGLGLLYAGRKGKDLPALQPASPLRGSSRDPAPALRSGQRERPRGSAGQ